MARLRHPSTSSNGDGHQKLARLSSQPVRRRITPESSAQPSPTPSTSSDKENYHAPSLGAGAEKRNSGSTSMSAQSESSGAAIPSRKRKLQEVQIRPTNVSHRRELEKRADKDFYDPDQDEEERRAVRKGMRELNKELNGLSFNPTSTSSTRQMLTGANSRHPLRPSESRFEWTRHHHTPSR